MDYFQEDRFNEILTGESPALGFTCYKIYCTYFRQQFDNKVVLVLICCVFISHVSFSEPSIAEKKALAMAYTIQKSFQKLLDYGYCTMVLGLGQEDQHHMACGRYTTIHLTLVLETFL